MSKKIKLSYFALLLSFFNLVFHYPFFSFVVDNFEISSANGVLLLSSLLICALLLNAWVFYIGLYALGKIGKWILAFFFHVSAIAVYFINSYGIIVDRSMIGNVLNTNYEESSSFVSIGLFVYLIFLGVLPSIILFKIEIIKPTVKRFFTHVGLTLIALLAISYANAPNWLWIDKNSKTLGGLVMPWSYVINTSRYYIKKNKENKKQILLPDATIKDNEKSVIVLVIGESARSGNFSLYGYDKDTNPLLSQVENLYHYKAESCATYTTAGVKCILDHKETGKLYEILPNYLFRNNVEVIWRSTNWGEPKVIIDKFSRKEDLRANCEGDLCNYDEVLLDGLNEKILASSKNKVFVVLHTSTSHGPTYSKKYPEAFEKFSPVCTSVELANCTQEELINAYDNTIVYTDYILDKLIKDLKELEGYKTSMIYVSDHGESLGENNLYMHGIPKSIAPHEQLEIPFIVWASQNSKQVKHETEVTQHYVFHSVLDFLSIESPVYEEELSVFK